MRRLVLVFFVSFLLAAIGVPRLGNIPTAEASPPIYQGDLLLTGNNVTTLEGSFDINGSIIVEGNATLILKNAAVNITQTRSGEHTMLFRNAANGNPRLRVENSTITASNYFLSIELRDNSTATILHLDASNFIQLIPWDTSHASLSDSIIVSVYSYGYSTVQISNSTITMNLWACSHSTVIASSNCTIERAKTSMYQGVLLSTLNISGSRIKTLENSAYSADCSISNLAPGFFQFWDFKDNCSITTNPSSQVPNVTLYDCEIQRWSFGPINSSSRIFNSALYDLDCVDVSIAVAYDSTFHSLYTHDFSIFHSVNSTSNNYYCYDQGTVNVYWYLDVHVTDSIDQNVPSSNVTAFYLNATIAESKLTDANGLARLTVMEKMMNQTGQYPVEGYTVAAIYGNYSSGGELNMTGNKAITLILGGLIIPEFPSLLILPLFMIVALVTVAAYRRRPSARVTKPLFD